jgi:hypothetical protein
VLVLKAVDSTRCLCVAGNDLCCLITGTGAVVVSLVRANGGDAPTPAYIVRGGASRTVVGNGSQVTGWVPSKVTLPKG